MLVGVIQRFEQERGFGIVRALDNREHFLHVRQLRDRSADISIGAVVVFEKAFDAERKRDIAINCRLINTGQDWIALINLLGQYDAISIEERQSSRNSRGRTYNYTEQRKFSITLEGTQQLFRGKDVQWLKKIIIRAFNEHLDHQYFVLFCELLENVLPASLAADDAKALLAELFSYFGTRLAPPLLFYTWRSQRFRYIGKEDSEYEIPEQVLSAFMGELTLSEWKRIQTYSFGPALNLSFFETQVELLNSTGPDRLRDLYGLLEFLPESEVESKRQMLIAYSVKLYRANVTMAFEQVPTIETEAHWQVYESLKGKIGPEIGTTERERLLVEIDAVIRRIASPGYRIQLWVSHVPIDMPLETIYDFFLTEATDMNLRSAILGRLTDTQQLESLVLYRAKYGIVNALLVLENYLKSVNKGVYIYLRNNFFFDDFWSDKLGEDLLTRFRGFIQENAAEKEKYTLFFEGFYPEIPISVAFENVSTWAKDKFVYLVDKLPDQKDLVFRLLQQRILMAAVSELKWLCDYANEVLSEDQKKMIDGELFQRLPGEDYFQLWRSGRVGIIPEMYLLGFLERHPSVYQELKSWIADQVIQRDALSRILMTFLEQKRPISTFDSFYRHFFIIKFLVEGDRSLIVEVVAIQQPFYDLMLWALDYSETLDFAFLSVKFIYFNSDDQARVLRKIFYLKASGKLDFRVEELGRFVRVDADIYKLVQDNDPFGRIDISLAIILEALVSFATTRKFLVESELIAIAIRNLNGDKRRKFTIGELLEKCLGRMLAHQDFHTQGVIWRVPFAALDGNMTFYYALSFGPFVISRVFRDGFWQDGEVYNENFSELVEEVKKIPGRKWNPDKMHWGIPRQSETEAINFAKRNRFLIEFGGDKSKENVHLVTVKRADVPDGVTFCEGRIANRLHDTFDRKFWWCEGKPCFQNCETVHAIAEWEKYTLFDFCNIMEFDLTEVTGTGDVLDNGAYYQFAAQMNRFSRLLDKMYCEDCGEILYPVGMANFAAHNVVRFSCINHHCSQYQAEVYLNHCMNGKCNNIIDSRVSRQCPHGLRICDECGSCCSHAMLVRRLQNLRDTGGYIHPDLVRNVQEQRGHLEIPEYFCYKDGSPMKEIERDVFECACGVVYDTRKYKFKRRPRPGQSPVTEQ